MPADPTTLAALTRIFVRLGAPDAEGWARSQVEEGIPQLARFLFLRQAWAEVVAEGDEGWIDAWIEEGRGAPGAPFAGVGAALERLRASGARDGDVAEVVRGMQAQLLFALCHLLDGPGEVEPEAQGVRWALVQVGEEGEVVALMDALHESVLETDPTGREMRPG